MEYIDFLENLAKAYDLIGDQCDDSAFICLVLEGMNTCRPERTVEFEFKKLTGVYPCSQISSVEKLQGMINVVLNSDQNTALDVRKLQGLTGQVYDNPNRLRAAFLRKIASEQV